MCDFIVVYLIKTVNLSRNGIAGLNNLPSEFSGQVHGSAEYVRPDFLI